MGSTAKDAQAMRGHQRVREATITLDGCFDVIRELQETGSQPTSVKLALWGAVLSIRTKLEPNGNQTRVMAPFVNAPLPADKEMLRAWLQSGTGAGVTDNQLTGLYVIEGMAQAGTLPECPQDDWSLDQWTNWAARVEKIYSLGPKTARFAGLLCCPLTCPLVPVDMWVMIRLGYDHDAPKSAREYADVVRQVIDERDRNGHNDIPMGAWHWFKWSEIRQECCAEPLSERPQSHRLLSPRWY